MSEVLIFDVDRPGATDLADTGAAAGLAGAGEVILTVLALGTGALASGTAFLAAGLAATEGSGLAALAVGLAAEAVLAEPVDADLLDDADVFVTGSSFPKCVIH